MKKLTKLIIAMAVAVTVMVAGSAMAMAADTNGYVTMEKPTSTSEVTVNVDLTNFYPKYTSASSVSVTAWNLYDYNTGNLLYSGEYYSESIPLTCPKGFAGQVKLVVDYRYTTSSGSTYSGTENDYYYVNAKPASLSKSNIGVNIYSSLGKIYFNGAKDNYATGIEYKLYNMKTGKCIKTIKSKYTSTDSFGISTNVPYKWKARQYYVNETNGNTYYGSWTGYKYFMNPNVTATKNYSTGKTTIKVKGVSKVTKYEIRVSNTTGDRSGTLVKTLKPSVGKTASYSVKTSKSYIKVIPVLSGDHKSDVWSYYYR